MANQFVCCLLLLIAATSTNAQFITHSGIQGGVAAPSGARSYVVSVKGSGESIICGGALYNDVTVITVASCLVFLNPEKLLVGVNNGTKTVKVVAHLSHPDYGFYTTEHDVALLKLAESVSAEYVKLPSKTPVTGSAGIVTGWDANNSLVDVSETIIARADCVSGKYDYDDDDVLASNVCGLADNKACNAVAGVPLVSDNQLVGLLSWGAACANDKNPAVFTDAFAEKSWIESNVNSL
ncbi:PREDICTED: trypsin alpha-3-like isoform X2 [Rhagoletis zephyria]|uniref:trypsin alpha-3-like isoform X1 n=1 Tax=Rhagoletis zephyria TaxID=28612 RepID=UPI0008114537|nr:PREDICTED: trypsin alpha-3-like isoform X1 [Rhagoletis zephyria]XP_017472637.1 PREDICTED: trypsin alpha-3-like isoform X2 [Rhagoletis zephyria]